MVVNRFPLIGVAKGLICGQGGTVNVVAEWTHPHPSLSEAPWAKPTSPWPVAACTNRPAERTGETLRRGRHGDRTVAIAA